MSDDQELGILSLALSRLNEMGLATDVLDSSADHPVLRLRWPGGDLSLHARISLKVAANAFPPLPAEAYPTVLIAPYVNPSVADALRKQGVFYVDTAGNVFLRRNGLFADVRGRPRPAEPIHRTSTARAFKNTGLRIIFVLLCRPQAADSSYRDIAQLSGTSVGTVHGVLNDLQKLGFLSVDDGDRRLRRQAELFRRWVDAYITDLGPRLTIGTFVTPDATWWQHSTEEVEASDGQWGGEVAAHLLGSTLIPGRVTVYAPQVPKSLALRHRFQRASEEDATVEIRERFWFFLSPKPSPTVPTPLVYADLLATGDPRAAEAARYLQEHDEVLRRLTER